MDDYPKNYTDGDDGMVTVHAEIYHDAGEYPCVVLVVDGPGVLKYNRTQLINAARFTDPEALYELAGELNRAAAELKEQQREITEAERDHEWGEACIFCRDGRGGEPDEDCSYYSG